MPESRPLLSTMREILSGFSSTSLCVSAEPMVVTMPSPTRAMIVSSPAPPTNRLRLARTVTRALALTSMPFLATALTTGVSITLGVTLICTACSTSRPARSIAAVRSNPMSIPARCAAMSALTTRSTFPPAKKCASSLLISSPKPALLDLISVLTIRAGGTRRRRIPIRVTMPIGTPAARAEIHKPSGTKLKKMETPKKISAMRNRLSGMNGIF